MHGNRFTIKDNDDIIPYNDNGNGDDDARVTIQATQ